MSPGQAWKEVDEQRAYSRGLLNREQYKAGQFAPGCSAEGASNMYNPFDKRTREGKAWKRGFLWTEDK